MSATEIWRVVDGLGGVREVPVRVEGELLLVGPGPQPRYYGSEEPPRLALMHYALTMRWPLREILSPEDASRLALLDGLLAVIHRDGGHYLAQHGVKHACGEAVRRVLADREELALAEREHVAAERARCAAVCRDVGAGRAGPRRTRTAERDIAAHDCAEAIERGPVTP